MSDWFTHPDSQAVSRFADAMRDKMARSRLNGRHGWERVPRADLWNMLREHVAKGDPVDIANFAMMIWHNAQRTEARDQHAATVMRHAKCGDLLTHRVCAGILHEHVFTGMDGLWMCGRATLETTQRDKMAAKTVNDISPANVTHINRMPIDALDYLAQDQ